MRVIPNSSEPRGVRVRSPGRRRPFTRRRRHHIAIRRRGDAAAFARCNVSGGRSPSGEGRWRQLHRGGEPMRGGDTPAHRRCTITHDGRGMHNVGSGSVCSPCTRGSAGVKRRRGRRRAQAFRGGILRHHVASRRVGTEGGVRRTRGKGGKEALAARAPDIIDYQRRVLRGCVRRERWDLRQVAARGHSTIRGISRALIPTYRAARRISGKKLQQAPALGHTGLIARRDGVGEVTTSAVRNMISYSASGDATSSPHREPTGT